ncbi:MAG: excinuclease ABC subunit UvrA, partial [Clostridiales bacterium]|nr:excinuclease ABC subunit UvrA [Clostridiales bacterium]
TVGTVTEIYDYLRLLFAHIGTVHCPVCGKEISQTTVDQIFDKIMAMGEGRKIMVEAPVVRGRKGEFVKQIDGYKRSGYVRFRVDGAIYSSEEEIKLDKNTKHSISVIVDRLVVKPDIQKRLTDSVENALKLADGLVAVDNEGERVLFNTNYACPDCDVSIEEVTPRMFSFNNPFGACPDCTGLGYKQEIDPALVIPDWSKSIAQGGLNVNGWVMETGAISQMYFSALAKRYNFSLKTPLKDLPQEIIDIILYGNKNEKLYVEYDSTYYSGGGYRSFEGLIRNLERRHRESTSDYIKGEIEKLMVAKPCKACGGLRLKRESLAVRVGGQNIAEWCARSVADLKNFIDRLKLTEKQQIISYQILKEVDARLSFLLNVGLAYLTLSRNAGTLSGGEAQRIRLATQIGSGLMGVLYILDEPSIGLHQRDNNKLLSTLKRLRDLGNTLIVVEHDEDTMRAADHIVDIGPGAGREGGELVAQGTLADIVAEPRSVTGEYLSGKKKIELPAERLKPNGQFVEILGARQNNLKGIDVRIPLGVLTAVTGVSGSGKSSLINQILYPVLANRLNGAKLKAGICGSVTGFEFLDKVIDIDQSPIGRTPRSNPATYTGVFNAIRELFAATPDAKERGYQAGRFSFNVKGGRCEACSGDGIIKIEMHFLPDVYVPCEVCRGKRYNRETLQVKYKGKSIYDVLDMTVEQAVEYFANLPSILGKIRTLYDVGLGYIKLGQPATTLSGGEAQRVKLATELAKRGTGKTIYILDEPTTGLHMADVHKLVYILRRLVSGGNTVVVIEHNLDVIKIADHIIDLGPEGGEGGGTVVAQGSPEEVARNGESFTGQYLKRML